MHRRPMPWQRRLKCSAPVQCRPQGLNNMYFPGLAWSESLHGCASSHTEPLTRPPAAHDLIRLPTTMIRQQGNLTRPSQFVFQSSVSNVASLQEEPAKCCADKCCLFRDYTTNCDPSATRTPTRVSWLLLEPLGAEVNKSGYVHTPFPTNKPNGSDCN
jgi:hypothetical protein